MKTIITIILGLVIGYISSLKVTSNGVDKNTSSYASETTGATTPSEARRKNITPTSTTNKHTLESLLSYIENPKFNSGNKEITHELGKFSDDELRDLILDFMSNPPNSEDKEIKMRLSGIWQLFANELYVRQGATQLDWAMQLPDQKIASASCNFFLKQLALEHPQDALRYATTLKEKFGEQVLFYVCQNAIYGATARSAKELVEIENTWGDLLHGTLSPRGTFADDFDFAYYVANSKAPYQRETVFDTWSRHDADAAFQYAMQLDAKSKKMSPNSTLVDHLISSAQMRIGEDKAMEWSATQLAKADEATRENVLPRLSYYAEKNPENFKKIFQLLPNEEDRSLLMTGFFTSFEDPQNPSKISVEMINLLSPTQQQAIVESLILKMQNNTDEEAIKINGFMSMQIENKLQQTKIDDATKAQLLERIAKFKFPVRK